MQSEINEKKIVIIGAGPAGISAGVKLLEYNFHNILILEAENRIGGRIHSVSNEHGVIELGAQWCHGEENNIIYEMANKYNLFSSDNDKYENSQCISSNGMIIQPSIINQLFKLIETILNTSSKSSSTNNKNNNNKNNDISNNTKELSLGEYIEERFNEALNNNDLYKHLDKNIAKDFLNYYHKYRNSIEGSDSWYDTTINEMNEYSECKGDRLLNWKSNGFKTILDILMKKYPYQDQDNSTIITLENKILFQKCVKQINQIMTNNGNQNTIEIICTDNSIYKCDHIIVTVSLGVLKYKHLELFQPELPIEKQNAIMGLAFGTVNKIYLEYNKSFWPSNWKGFNCVWDSKDIQMIRDKIIDFQWIEDIFGFYTNDYQPNIIYTWISGENARKIEHKSNEHITEGLMYILKKFLTNTLLATTSTTAALSQSSMNDDHSIIDIIKPNRIYRSNWYTNPHFYGSYSFRSIKSDKLNVFASDLAEPIYFKVQSNSNSNEIDDVNNDNNNNNKNNNQPIIQFAGEATHSKYYSCVHGAIESGFREAKRLLDYYI